MEPEPWSNSTQPALYFIWNLRIKARVKIHFLMEKKSDLSGFENDLL